MTIIFIRNVDWNKSFYWSLNDKKSKLYYIQYKIDFKRPAHRRKAEIQTQDLHSYFALKAAVALDDEVVDPFTAYSSAISAYHILNTKIQVMLSKRGGFFEFFV